MTWGLSLRQRQVYEALAASHVLAVQDTDNYPRDLDARASTTILASGGAMGMFAAKSLANSRAVAHGRQVQDPPDERPEEVMNLLLERQPLLCGTWADWRRQREPPTSRTAGPVCATDSEWVPQWSTGSMTGSSPRTADHRTQEQAVR